MTSTQTSVKVYVPCDSAALAVGADEVASALLLACAQQGLAAKKYLMRRV